MQRMHLLIKILIDCFWARYRPYSQQFSEITHPTGCPIQNVHDQWIKDGLIRDDDLHIYKSHFVPREFASLFVSKRRFHEIVTSSVRNTEPRNELFAATNIHVNVLHNEAK